MTYLAPVLIFIIALSVPFGFGLEKAPVWEPFCKLMTGDFHEETPDVCVRGNSTLHK